MRIKAVITVEGDKGGTSTLTLDLQNDEEREAFAKHLLKCAEDWHAQALPKRKRRSVSGSALVCPKCHRLKCTC